MKLLVFLCITIYSDHLFTICASNMLNLYTKENLYAVSTKGGKE